MLRSFVFLWHWRTVITRSAFARLPVLLELEGNPHVHGFHSGLCRLSERFSLHNATFPPPLYARGLFTVTWEGDEFDCLHLPTSSGTSSASWSLLALSFPFFPFRLLFFSHLTRSDSQLSRLPMNPLEMWTKKMASHTRWQTFPRRRCSIFSLVWISLRSEMSLWLARSLLSWLAMIMSGMQFVLSLPTSPTPSVLSLLSYARADAAFQKETPDEVPVTFSVRFRFSFHLSFSQDHERSLYLNEILELSENERPSKHLLRLEVRCRFLCLIICIYLFFWRLSRRTCMWDRTQDPLFPVISNRTSFSHPHLFIILSLTRHHILIRSGIRLFDSLSEAIRVVRDGGIIRLSAGVHVFPDTKSERSSTFRTSVTLIGQVSTRENQNGTYTNILSSQIKGDIYLRDSDLDLNFFGLHYLDGNNLEARAGKVTHNLLCPFCFRSCQLKLTRIIVNPEAYIHLLDDVKPKISRLSVFPARCLFHLPPHGSFVESIRSTLDRMLSFLLNCVGVLPFQIKVFQSYHACLWLTITDVQHIIRNLRVALMTKRRDDIIDCLVTLSSNRSALYLFSFSDS